MRFGLFEQVLQQVGQTIALGGLSRVAQARNLDRRQKPIIRPTSGAQKLQR
jgi:hypothetical protein